MTLWLRVIVVTVGVVLVTAVTVGLLTYAATAHYLGAEVDRSLVPAAQAFSDAEKRELRKMDRQFRQALRAIPDATVIAVKAPIGGVREVAPSAACKRFERAEGAGLEPELAFSPGVAVRWIDARGTPCFPPHDRDPALPVDASTRAVAAGRTNEHFDEIAHDGVRWRVRTVSVVDGVAMQTMRPLQTVDSTLSQLRWILLGAGVVATLLAAALAGPIVRRALAPIGRFTGSVRQIRATRQLSHRISLDDDVAEVRTLGQEFDLLLDQLGRAEEAQRQLVSDASHELRTPLTTLRANLELFGMFDALPGEERRTMLAEMSRQVGELNLLVNDLVDLARDNIVGPQAEHVPMDDLARTVVERAKRLLPGTDIRLVCSEPWSVVGDRALLERAVHNLIDNAVKFSGPQPIEVRSAAGSLSVRDRGPGFVDDDLSLVFDRFYRSSAARALPGSGLGLAIVRRLAEEHGGRAVAANADGGGAMATIHLPSSRDASAIL